MLLLAVLAITGGFTLLLLSSGEKCTTTESTTIETDVLRPVVNQSQQMTFLKGYYSCNQPEKYDVVYYKHSGLEEPLLRQIKATPGDKMNFEGCNLKINNETLRNAEGRKYCFEGKRKDLLQLYTGEISGYLLLTEKVSGGFDSTRFGLVSRNSLKGKVVPKKFLGIF